MGQGLSKREVVRLAKEQLGEVPAPQMADYIQQQYGITLQPTIVTVLLGSLKEREHLENTRLKAQSALEQALAEQALEKKAKRKTRQKSAPAGPQGSAPAVSAP